MTTRQARTEIMSALVRLIAEVVLNNTEIARRLGLGASDAQFLSLLDAHGPMTPGALAARTRLSTGTVTGVLDRLEHGGYVRRERDPGDRRKVLVVPDAERLAHVQAQYVDHAHHLEQVLAGRTAAELDVILAFLRDLAGPAEPAS